MEAYDLLEQALETKHDDKRSSGSEDLENNYNNNSKDRKHSKHKEKTKDKSKDKEKDKSKKHKDKSDDKVAEKKSKDKDRNREKSRHQEDRDRERSSHKRSRDEDHYRSRSRHRSKSRRHRSPTYEEYYDRKPSPRRAATPPEVRAQKEQEREQADLERHTRTVFAYNLSLRATERELFEFFSKAGRVQDVKLIMDRSTRKSKGIAYIEFEKQDDVISALMLTGQLLLGQTVMVKASEAEKNLAWEAQQQAQKNQVQVASIQQPILLNLQQQQVTESEQIIVSNLHPDISEQDIRDLFKSFGSIQTLQVSQEQGSGAAVIRYQSVSDAKRAVDTMDNLDLVGRNISVKLMALQQEQPQVVQKPEETESLFEEEGGFKNSQAIRKALLSRLANQAGMKVDDQVNPLERAAQLQKQQQAQTGNGVSNPVSMEQGVLGPGSPIPTPCLLLKNLFDPNEESGDDWDQDIAEDVKSECEKYGQVTHIFVQKNSKGYVYVKFGSTD